MRIQGLLLLKKKDKKRPPAAAPLDRVEANVASLRAATAEEGRANDEQRRKQLEAARERANGKAEKQAAKEDTVGEEKEHGEGRSPPKLEELEGPLQWAVNEDDTKHNKKTGREKGEARAAAGPGEAAEDAAAQERTSSPEGEGELPSIAKGFLPLPERKNEENLQETDRLEDARREEREGAKMKGRGEGETANAQHEEEQGEERVRGSRDRGIQRRDASSYETERREEDAKKKEEEAEEKEDEFGGAEGDERLRKQDLGAAGDTNGEDGREKEEKTAAGELENELRQVEEEPSREQEPRENILEGARGEDIRARARSAAREEQQEGIEKTEGAEGEDEDDDEEEETDDEGAEEDGDDKDEDVGRNERHEEEDTVKEASIRSPVEQGESSADEVGGGEEQLSDDSSRDETRYRREEEEGDEEVARGQAITQDAPLLRQGGADEKATEQEEAAKQQQDEKENEGQERETGDVQEKEQEDSVPLEQETEERQPEQQEQHARQQGAEVGDIEKGAGETQGVALGERQNGPDAFVEEQSGTENNLRAAKGKKTRGEDGLLSDIEEDIQQEVTQKPHSEEYKDKAGTERAAYGTKDEQKNEREHDTVVAAHESDMKRKTTTDKRPEKGEEKGEENGKAAAAKQSDEGKQASKQAGEGGAGKEETTTHLSQQRVATLLQQKGTASAPHPEAYKALEELAGLIGSLDALAKRFEEQQKQLKEQHLEERPHVYLDKDTVLQKQEQLIKEVKEQLPALVANHEHLLDWLRGERERILEPTDGHATVFIRGAVIGGANSNREELLQHHHIEKLVSAFTQAAKRFGATIQQVNECSTAFSRDHDRALQVVYEYGRAVDLLNIGVQMNHLSKSEIEERVHACSEAFSVLSNLLVTCDKRVASIMGLTGALEATQGLSLAHLEQAIQVEEREEAAAAALLAKPATADTTVKTEEVPTTAGEKNESDAELAPAEVTETLQQRQRKQVLEAARQAVNVLERLGVSVAEATRTVVNVRAKWLEELSTQLLRHFDGLVRAGKQLRSREEQRWNLKLSEEQKHAAGRHQGHSSWESEEINGRSRGITAAGHRRPPWWGWGRETMKGVPAFPRPRKKKVLAKVDIDFDDWQEAEGEEDEDVLESAPSVAMEELRETVQHRDTPVVTTRLQDAFRRQAERAAEQCAGRPETHLLHDVNLEGWKAIQQMAEGAEFASKVARDTREAIEKEIGGDTTTTVLGVLLGIALVVLLVVVLYGYHMVFSYEERINAYRIGKRSGQAVDATGDTNVTTPEQDTGMFTRERGFRRMRE